MPCSSTGSRKSGRSMELCTYGHKRPDWFNPEWLCPECFERLPMELKIPMLFPNSDTQKTDREVEDTWLKEHPDVKTTVLTT